MWFIGKLILFGIIAFVIVISYDMVNSIIIDLFKSKKQREKEKERDKRILASIERESQQKENREKEIKDYLNSLPEKYKEEPKVIRYGDRFMSRMLIFETSKVVVIEKKEYRFEDIIEFSIIEHETNGQVFETKTSLGGVVKRSLIGGIIAGPVGAIIGGVTTKSKTNVVISPKIPPELKIIVNDLNNPHIILKNPLNLDKLVDTLSIIIKRASDEMSTQ